LSNHEKWLGLETAGSLQATSLTNIWFYNARKNTANLCEFKVTTGKGGQPMLLKSEMKV